MMNQNPYETVTVDDTQECLGTWRDGELVVVSSNGVLPSRCVSCNKTATHFVRYRISYDETTAKNMPTRERPMRILAPSFVAIVSWLAGIYVSSLLLPIKNYPTTFAVTAIVSLMLSVWLVGLVLRGVQTAAPVRFGLCKPCYVLRWIGNTMTLVGLAGILVCVVLIDFRSVAWVEAIRFRLGLVVGVLFAVGMVLRTIQLYTYHPVLAKEDETKRLWVKGISKAFRESLPEFES